MIPYLLAFAFSALVFAAWFRYSCNMILRMRTATNYTPPVSAALDLSFEQIQRRLAMMPGPMEMETFRGRLKRDYERVGILLSRLPAGSRYFTPSELATVRAQYRLSVTRDLLSVTFLGIPSHAALCDMSQIVGFLANIAGAACAARCGL